MPDPTQNTSPENGFADTVARPSYTILIPTDDRKRWARVVPSIPQSMFYGSAALGLATMLFLCGKERPAPWSDAPLWLSSISSSLDPLFLQFASVLLVTVIMVTHYYPQQPLFEVIRRHPLHCMMIVLSVGGLLAVSYVLELWWLKPAFGVHERPSAYREAFLTSWLRMAGGDHSGSCPSGFVIRQVLLILTGLAFASARGKVGDDPHPHYYGAWTRMVMLWLAFLVAATVGVAVLRVAAQAHTRFDVAMGIGTGTYVFWLIYFVIGTLARVTERNFFTDIVAMTCVFLPVFCFYSQQLELWAVSSIIIFVFLGVMYHYVPAASATAVETVPSTSPYIAGGMREDGRLTWQTQR